ncbi:MAG: molybdopterin-dependent oxidoreductase, partial [Dehalococcoidia bacterium]
SSRRGTSERALAPAPESEGAIETNWSRRRLLARVSIVLVMLGVGGAAFFRAGSRATPTGPVRADEPALIPSDPAFVATSGQSPKITPTEDHYTVDIDLENPLIGESSWRLRVDGAVENELSFTLDDLRAMRTVERLYNLSCISNQVGGSLIGNSRWTGVPLDTLFDMAVPRSEAVTLLARSYDGYEEGILLDDIRNKGALIAIGMNGMLLPRDHGFPARMLFPNHYGMRSVKWLTKITLLTEDREGYWAQRGWDRDAVVRTQSRVDAPRDGEEVRGPFVCVGVAWAGARGVAGVEVSPDGGETWQAAQLETELSALSWRRWRVELDLPAGRHTLAVRATDGTGMQQEARERDPHPSGASGYHRVVVRVL